MASNPLLDAGALPAFSRIEPGHVGPAVDAVLADYRDAVETLTRAGVEHDFDSLMRELERHEQRLEQVWSPVSHLHSVADSKPLREAYAQAQEKITDFASELGQNRALYDAVRKLSESGEFADLPREARTLVEHTLRDFRLSGVALEEPARSRFRQIANALAQETNAFAEAVLDASEAWEEHISDATALAGVPESGLSILRQYAREKDLEGYRVTLRQPAVQAVLTYADDRALRQRVYRAYNTRASENGPGGEAFDNSARIERILSLRHEAAGLLDFANAAEESLATKMADSPQAVLEFLRDLVARAKPLAQEELTGLRRFAREQLGLDTLESWDIAWAAEKRRRERFELDEEQLKPYFPLPAVLDGLFAVAGHLFGISLALRDGVETWHPDVRYYDVRDSDGSVVAGVYLDLYARAGKRGGAWMDVCRARFRDRDKLTLPVAYLTCNFPPPGDDKPALLTHDEVLTVFHEFGHGLHHMLTEVDLPSVAGIDGVEWDAVELPSQFMENFAWSREGLESFARHWSTGEPLPQVLFDRMLAARHFHAGMFLLRQLEFGLFDFRLHLEYQPERGAQALELLEDVRREVAVLHPPQWQRFPHAFTHVFAGGYAAGYYSYLWAEELAADAFARFDAAGVFDRETGAAFRREILAVGGSRPALESFIAFRGREPHPDALLKSYGLAA